MYQRPKDYKIFARRRTVERADGLRVFVLFVAFFIPIGSFAQLKYTGQTPSQLVSLASDLMAKRDYRRAEIALNWAAEVQPSYPEAYLALGKLYADEGRIEDAIGVYSALLADQPNSQQAKVALTKLFFQANKFSAVLELCEPLLAESSLQTALRAEILPSCIGSEVGDRHPEKTEPFIAEAIKIGETNPSVLPKVAEAFLQLNLVGDAGQVLQLAARTQTPNAQFLTVLAKVQARSGDTQKAQQSIEQALKSDPGYADALLEGARLAGRTKDWISASKYMDRVIKTSTPNVKVLQSAIYAFMQVDDLIAAHAAAVDLYAIAPTTENALTLGIVFVRSAHWGDAKQYLDKVLKDTPNDKRALLGIGLAEYNLGDLPASKKHLAASLGQGAPDAEADHFLGLIAKQEGNVDEAVQFFEAALSIEPKQAKSMTVLGQLFAQTGELEKAQKTLEQAIELFPADSQAHFQLAQVYRRLGMQEKSAEQLKTFQELTARKVANPAGEMGTQSPQ